VVFGYLAGVIDSVPALRGLVVNKDDDQSSNPDREILDAIRPSLSTTGGMLVCITA
jgi:hypothetical protein